MTLDQSLKIIFAGTPEFAAAALKKLLTTHHKIISVYTQPDRPAGRGQKLTASPVKEIALLHNIPLFQPATLRDEIEQQKLAELNADLMIVAAYGLILPKKVLTTPRLGCINIHASLLPRWRGAAPIQRAILAGDNATGITIMQMDEGLDTGAMLYKTKCAITAEDTTATLHDKLAQLGSEAIVTALELLSQNKLIPEPQNNAEASYAQKISKEEALIDWNQSAEEIARKIRAFNPWPVAHVGPLRIWQAEILNEVTSQNPGTIVRATVQGIDVATSKNILRITHLQLPGGRALPAKDILNARAKDFAPHTQIGQNL